MKIAVQTDDKDAVIGFASTYSKDQLQVSGWQEIEADPYFNSGNYADWKIVNSQLVKKDSGMTPLEESQMALTALTQQNIQLAQENNELKAAVTATTKELVTTKEDVKQTQQAITALTQLQIGQTTNK